MATKTQYTCDVCGKLKGTTNHWYVLFIGVGKIVIWPWKDAHQPGALHICGEACLLKKISERLGRESFAAVETGAPMASAETIGAAFRRIGEAVDAGIADINNELEVAR